MKKFVILCFILLIGAAAYLIIPALSKSKKKAAEDKPSGSFLLPKVLILTTGGYEGNGELSEGVVVAIQSFNKRGAFVRLDNRDVLLKPDVLSQYSIMLIPTSIGYHDGDKKYSLTFLSDLEMENISTWVRNGGTLIAEENTGRNNTDGSDRANLNDELNSNNWKLSDVFGINMMEIDLNGFSIEEKDINIWNGRIREPLTENEWALIPSKTTSDKLKVLAEWVNAERRIPAIIQNEYGKGKAYLLTSTYLLHPSNDGGFSGIEQIDNFYKYILKGFPGSKTDRYSVNPWPEGKSSAFCISFGCSGEKESYELLTSFLKKENLAATFFADSALSEDEENILKENKLLSIQSGLYSQMDLSTAGYSDITREFILEEQHLSRVFQGVRFPFNSTNFYGLVYANDNGYIFDSSIGVDHLTSYSGSVFPYNIPVALNAYYKALNLIEMCPVKNDDTYYFRKADIKDEYTEDIQREDAGLFEKYLLDFYNYVIERNHGLMIYSGKPSHTGFSEITLQPLKKLIDTLRSKNCWMSSLENVAAFRNKLKDLSIEASESGDDVRLKITLPDSISVKTFSLKFEVKPENISASEKFDLNEASGNYYLVTDIKNGDEIRFTLK